VTVSAEPVGALKSFLGRDEQLSELVELLEEAGMITLTGAPGIGKSRLGVELADRHPGVRQVVERAAVTRPADVPRAVASALSVQDVAGQSLTEVLVARLSRRRSLLVLDNCEHLLEGCRELIGALLSGCPELRVLATSREPLGLAAERVWQVPPLAVPAGDEETSPEGLLDYAAVALFSQRAAAVEPGFALNSFVAPAVAEICRRLDGIPLAIELAAARVPSLAPDEIVPRLDDRFGLLTADGAGLPARHQTLAAALDWSYALLSEPEQALLRRLSPFIGGFDGEAVEAVCAGEGIQSAEIPGLLARLVAKSLVAQTVHGSCSRFRLLETIRAYGRERLEEAGETSALRSRHARYYVALAERAEPALTGANQEHWLERLEAEHANLRAAYAWSLGHGEHVQALRLACALVLFWRRRCHFTEGREWLVAATAVSGEAPVALRTEALWGAGFMTLMTGDVNGALPALEASLSSFEEIGDRQGQARALLLVGGCAQYMDHERALSLLDQSAVLAREVDDPWCLVHALSVAGSLRLGTDLSSAQTLLEECLTVARNAGDSQGIGYGLLGLGAVAVCKGDYRRAEPLLEEAVAITAALGEHYCEALALGHLAELAFGMGDYGRAQALLDRALTLIQEIGQPFAWIDVLSARAVVAHAQGDRHGARKLFDDAIRRLHAVHAQHYAVLQGMARLAADDGRSDQARRLFEEALELTRGSGAKGGTAQALQGLAEMARVEGKAELAARLHSEALELWHELGSIPGAVGSLEAIAGLHGDAGRYEHAARLLGAAKASRNLNGYARVPWEAGRYESDLAAVRAAIGEREFDAACTAGAALSIAEAVAEDLTAAERLRRLMTGLSSLTATERQVADLVAEGMTNQEIAERLFISRGTAKRQLARIFRKLGLISRIELAQEVRRHRENSR
jgi:RNA polymerase sigma factor (sigma-70 family)